MVIAVGITQTKVEKKKLCDTLPGRQIFLQIDTLFGYSIMLKIGYVFLAASLLYFPAGMVQSATFWYTVPGFVTIDVTNSSEGNPGKLYGSSIFSIPGFSPNFGTLKSVQRFSKIRSTVTGYGRVQGPEFRVSAAANFFTKSQTPNSIIDVYNANKETTAFAKNYVGSIPYSLYAVQNMHTRTLDANLNIQTPNIIDNAYQNILDDYTSYNNVEITAYARYEANLNGVITESLPAIGIFSTRYFFEPSLDFDFKATIVGRVNENPFSGQFVRTFYDEAEDRRIGFIDQFAGDPIITRVDGTVESIYSGTIIFLGDTVTTSTNEALTIEFFDETTKFVDQNSRVSIDEYIPNSNGGESNINLLRKIFVFTSELIGRDKKDKEVTEIPIISLGIRGDAAEIVNKYLEENPQEELGDIGIRVETASPVSISTILRADAGLVNFGFDYTFFDLDSSLRIVLGGVEVFNAFSDLDNVGILQSLSGVWDWDGFTKELKFILDGSAGKSLLLSSLIFDGLDLAEFATWTGDGAGTKEFVYLMSEEKFDQAFGGVSAVPLPAAAPLFGTALALLGFVVLRKRRKLEPV